MQLILADPRGFCAGVERAIDIVNKALDKFGSPLYVKHEIVHNKYVVNSLKDKGVIFVDNIADVPEGANVIFSAHGVSNDVEKKSVDRNLMVIDATCPLVKKVHFQAQKFEQDGRIVILIGHAGHPEVEGTSGRIETEMHLVSNADDVDNLSLDSTKDMSYLTQTTLSVDDTKKIIDRLKAKYPHIEGPELKDICYATQNRQNAIKKLAEQVDLLLVVGSQNSSNSNRLRDLGEEKGVESYLVNDFNEISLKWFENKKTIGLSAGASAPEYLVQDTIDFLQKNFSDLQIDSIEGIEENIHFNIPKILRS